jgi:hypothetical protein
MDEGERPQRSRIQIGGNGPFEFIQMLVLVDD